MLRLKSRVAKKLLSYFFLHENESFYLNELVRQLDVDKRNLVKKLKEFEAMGLFETEAKGNLKIYSLNKRFPLYKEYKTSIFKSEGLKSELQKTLGKVKGIKRAFIYGSFASGTQDSLSDIDLMIIGDHSVLEVQQEITKLQKKMNREINLINLSEKELIARKKDPFIANVMKNKKIELL